MPVIAIPRLILLGLALAAIVGLIVLLVHPRTRWLGLAIASAGLALLLTGLFSKSVHVSRPAVGDSAQGSPAPAVVSSSPGSPPPETAAPVRQAVSAAAKPAPRGGVLAAIGRAVAAALSPGGSLATSRPAPPAKPQATARPAWVDAPPHYADNAYLMPVAVGPYTTRLECDAAVPEALQQAVAKYVEAYLGPEAARHTPAEFTREQLVGQQWEETVESSVGRMITLHLELRFTAAMQDALRDALRQATAAERLRWAAGGLAGVLALLGALFGYLKLTTVRIVPR
jgi:hypothetical protein